MGALAHRDVWQAAAISSRPQQSRERLFQTGLRHFGDPGPRKENGSGVLLSRLAAPAGLPAGWPLVDECPLGSLGSFAIAA